jgi:hypothetical protein
MTLPHWWEGLDPVDVGIAVGDTTHALRWSAGALHSDVHPDLESEIALGALGADRCACLDVIALWHHRGDDALDVLTVGRRNTAEKVFIADYVVRNAVRSAETWLAYSAGAGMMAQGLGVPDMVAAVGRRLALVRLLNLDARLSDRLQATVLARAIDRWGDAAFRAKNHARLTAALAGRAGPALRAGGVAYDGIDLLPPGAPAEVSGGRAGLPIDWLTNVWARDAAVDGGRFVTRITAVLEGGKVLAVQGVDGDDWRITRH